MDNYHYGPFTRYDPKAVLEIKATTKDDSQKIYQRFRGTIHLKSHLSQDGFHIRVIQCEHIQSVNYNRKCSSFVKISVSSINSTYTKCSSKVVGKTNSPIYDEQLFVDLCDKDHHKRLLISVWNEGTKTIPDELVGCTSFGIKNLLESSKVIDGWYYLLNDDIGIRRHMKVCNFDSIQKFPANNNNNFPENKEIQPIKSLDYKKHKIIVLRGKNGFGFSLNGERPVLISKIVPDSPAFNAKLRVKDELIRINGENVTNSSSHIVAKIVKHSEKAIKLEIKRLDNDSNDESIVENDPELQIETVKGDEDISFKEVLKKHNLSLLWRFCSDVKLH